MSKAKLRKKRAKRVRSKIFGTKERPRVCIFKSNKHIYAQAIDDEKGVTLASACDIKMKAKNLKEQSEKVGNALILELKKKKIKKIAFDRNGFAYFGNIKILAEVMRKKGIDINVCLIIFFSA